MDPKDVIININANFHHGVGEDILVRNDRNFQEYRQKWREWPQVFRVGEFPLFIDIEVTSACNLKCPFCATTFRGNQIKDGYIKFKFPSMRSARFNSQRKPEHYSFAGYVAFRVGSLRKYGNIWGEVSIGIQAEAIETVDIDTREDLENAIRLTETDVRGEASISSTIRGLGATV